MTKPIITVAKTQTQTSQLANPFKSLIGSQGLSLIVCCGLLIVIWFLPKCMVKAKLFKGRFGDNAKKGAAKRKALKQINSPSKNAVTVWLGTPSQNPLGQKPLYFPDAQKGIAVLGDLGKGKTVSVIDQIAISVFEQGFPAILWDFKYPTQTSCLAAYAAKCGYDVRVFAPGFLESEVCNPLDFLSDETDSLMARQLAEVMNSNFKRIGYATEDGFFGAVGDKVTEGLLMLAKGSKYPELMMAQILVSRTDLAKKLIAQKTKLVSAFCGETTIPTRLEGKTLLILGIDHEKRHVLAPLVATILHLLINKNVSFNRNDSLFLLADEVSSLYLPSLHHWLKENSKDGLCPVLGFQNLIQMEKIYGQELSRTIIGSCATKVVFNPQDYETARMLRMFADYLEPREVRLQPNTKERGGPKANVSYSEQVPTNALLKPSDFLHLPTDRCFLLNPYFRRGQEAYIPLQDSIAISQDYKAITEWSKTRWRYLREKLVARSPLLSVPSDELKARYETAAEMFLSFTKGSSTKV
jgi:type IV secretory pathway TraG/TraD family ATPase VirD4